MLRKSSFPFLVLVLTHDLLNLNSGIPLLGVKGNCAGSVIERRHKHSKLEITHCSLFSVLILHFFHGTWHLVLKAHLTMDLAKTATKPAQQHFEGG